MKKRQCRRCGHIIEEECRFCPECGLQVIPGNFVEIEEEDHDEDDVSKRTFYWLMSAIVVVVVFGVWSAFYILFDTDYGVNLNDVYGLSEESLYENKTEGDEVPFEEQKLEMDKREAALINQLEHNEYEANIHDEVLRREKERREEEQRLREEMQQRMNYDEPYPGYAPQENPESYQSYPY